MTTRALSTRYSGGRGPRPHLSWWGVVVVGSSGVWARVGTSAHILSARALGMTLWIGEMV